MYDDERELHEYEDDYIESLIEDRPIRELLSLNALYDMAWDALVREG